MMVLAECRAVGPSAYEGDLPRAKTARSSLPLGHAPEGQSNRTFPSRLGPNPSQNLES